MTKESEKLARQQDACSKMKDLFEQKVADVKPFLLFGVHNTDNVISHTKTSDK
jgi:hypothetical protein